MYAPGWRRKKLSFLHNYPVSVSDFGNGDTAIAVGKLYFFADSGAKCFEEVFEISLIQFRAISGAAYVLAEKTVHLSSP